MSRVRTGIKNLHDAIKDILSFGPQNECTVVTKKPEVHNEDDHVIFNPELYIVNDEDYLQVLIEGERIQAILNVRDRIINKTILNLDEVLSTINEKVKFDMIDAKFNIIIKRDDYTNLDFCDFLFNAHWRVITEYAVNNNVSILRVGEAKNKLVWLGDSYNFSSQSTPNSLDSLELTLYRSKPAKIVSLQSTDYKSNVYRSPVFGFGIYLFDEDDNLISNMVYKFFDENIAPEDAYRLNTPTTFNQLEDYSRPFF